MYENSHTYFRDALAPGPSLNLATQRFLECLSKDMKGIPQEVRVAPGSKAQVDLMDWVRDLLGTASTKAFMGVRLLQHDPDVISRLSQWDKDFHKLGAGLPRWLMKEAIQNLDKLHHAFESVGEDPETLPWVTRRIEMMEAKGMSDKDMGAAMFTLWVG